MSAIGLQSRNLFSFRQIAYASYLEAFACHVRGRSNTYHSVFMKVRSTEICDKVLSMDDSKAALFDEDCELNMFCAIAIRN